MIEMEKQLAKTLLEIGAISLSLHEPYVWSSGLKSPIYCDNRLTISFPAVRKQIAHGLVQLVQNHFPHVDLIAGTSTAGIPHAAWVSDKLDLPMCYVRSTTKGHGQRRQIEGIAEQGRNVVIIEDLISTGHSCITTAEALREVGCNILGIVAIFTYGLDIALEQLQEARVVAYTVSTYDTLIQVAVDDGKISMEQLERLKQWRKNPKDEGWIE